MMKHLVSACLLLAFVVLCLGSNNVNAETIKVKRVALPLNQAPGGTAWSIQNGIRVVGKGAKVILEVDTAETGTTGTAAWTLTAPGGSTATLDNASNFRVTFTADQVGFYYLSVGFGGQTAKDTIYASTYTGVGTDATAGCFCHPTTAPQIKSDWAKTGHAQIFKQGITGNLENEIDPTTGKSFGAYAASCIKCHTTGWDDKVNNNNFGYSVKQTGWDTTWFKGLPFANGDYWLAKDSTAKWDMLTAEQQSLGTIGCESCHGPSAGHKTGPSKLTIAKPKDAGVCNQCHNGSGRHSIGTWYNLSAHAKAPTATEGEGGRSNCQPCHTGDGFLYWFDHNKDTTGIAAAWNLKANANTQISCQVCHDPHKAATINADGTLDAGLRQVSVDSLRNGFKYTPAGASQVCSYCPRSFGRCKPIGTGANHFNRFADRAKAHRLIQPACDCIIGSDL